jgi:hypothetical protein
LAQAKRLEGSLPSLAFELDVSQFSDEPDAGFLHYRGESGVTDRQLVDYEYRESGSGTKESKSERAAEWLTRYLWTKGAPCKPKEVAQDAAREDPPITARQLARAAQQIGATGSSKGGAQSRWDLPSDLREMYDAQYGAKDG